MSELTTANKTNIDNSVVDDFGAEWHKFDQSELSDADFKPLFAAYFSVFPWQQLPENAEGFDLGCGSGRWANGVASRVGKLHCIDAASAALNVAQKNLSHHDNCQFHHASVDSIPLQDNSMDFGYSLGVLHHVPNTEEGIKACVAKLKPGAPLLLYLYYAFDNRPLWFKLIWRTSDVFRQLVCRLPKPLKHLACELIAATIYWPLSRTAKLLEKLGFNVNNLPLTDYRNRDYYVLRTDALDRFGTRLEQRFTREQITTMMQNAGLTNIRFSDECPYWVAVGEKL